MFYADGYSETFLESLSVQNCVWVALAAATRQLKNYMRLPSDHQTLSNMDAFLDKVWEAASNEDIVPCKQAIETVMSALPPEVDDNSYQVIVAENCLLSLVYALRCKVSGDKKEAHWAVMKAYDAADQMALIQRRALMGSEYTEADIRAMPVVQRELANQSAAFRAVTDVSDAKAIARLRAMSFTAEFATDDEWNTLSS